MFVFQRDSMAKEIQQSFFASNLFSPLPQREGLRTTFWVMV